MVDFLDSWVHIIPVWILDNILDQLIFPKLQKEVGPGVGNGCYQEARGFVSRFSPSSHCCYNAQNSPTQPLFCNVNSSPLLSTFPQNPPLIGNPFTWLL